MTLKEKSKLMDLGMIKRTLMRISHEILERNIGTKQLDGNEIPQGILDITLYRDDLTMIDTCPVVHSTKIDFDITDKILILVDDVLFTGRTIRCALDELIDLGRPRSIQLAVLVDRGHRELPIRADYVGKNIPTTLDESVEVRLKEVDGREEVLLFSKEK